MEQALGLPSGVTSMMNFSPRRRQGPTFYALFVGMNVKEYKGECYLSATSATNIHTEDAIPQIATFKHQIKMFNFRGSLQHGKAPSLRFLARDERRKPLRPMGERYKLQMDVSDDTGSVVVTLFDDITEKIVRKLVDVLLRECGDDINEVILPQDIQSLVSASHILELKSYTYYGHVPYESFTCTTIIYGSNHHPIKPQHRGKKRPHETSTSNLAHDESKYFRSLLVVPFSMSNRNC